MNNEQGYVHVHHSNGISMIEFFHPQSNAMPGHLLNELAEAIHNESINADIKVIVLRSGGEKAFCAGASFEELAAVQNETAGHRFFSGFAHVINAMRKAPQLIIARIQGKCVGGGVGIAAAADYAIATSGADVKLSELAVGIGPFVVGPAVERKIGLSAFSQLAIDATNWRPAEWAKQKGLYAELHADKEGMDESIHRLSNFLAHSNFDAIKELKHIFWQGTSHWDELLHQRAAVSGKLVLSEHTKQFIQHFKNNKK
ncbi:enoyl-CoA hydratase/isomerase family protein [Hydrotalea sp.]|uniref:enoyl-CoA hydratase/isomerase family protein n=1 Tax=Hydrotalea sp. TaxID=2881279 RepID=UPI003D0CAE0F